MMMISDDHVLYVLDHMLLLYFVGIRSEKEKRGGKKPRELVYIHSLPSYHYPPVPF